MSSSVDVNWIELWTLKRAQGMTIILFHYAISMYNVIPMNTCQCSSIIKVCKDILLMAFQLELQSLHTYFYVVSTWSASDQVDTKNLFETCSGITLQCSTMHQVEVALNNWPQDYPNHNCPLSEQIGKKFSHKTDVFHW